MSSARVGPAAGLWADHVLRRNLAALAAGMVCMSGLVQLAAALGTVTLVAVTGIDSILGLGPAVYLISGALAVGPAGRFSDRFGRMPVIRTGFLFGMVGPALTALGCWTESATLVFLGLACCGASQTIVLLSRAAAAEMFPPERRARGMSFVLFAAVTGAVFGPLVFGPLFANRALTPHDLALPWLGASLFAVAGLCISLLVRQDPRDISKAFAPAAEQGHEPAAASLRVILRRPGVPTALIGAVASWAVMVAVMNLAGYVAVGHHHAHGDIFTVISFHIVGMFGLVLIVGGIVDRIGRPRAMTLGLSVMVLSNVALIWLTGIGGMSLSLFGLGLGWNLAFVAASTDLVTRTAPHERGRLIGFSDLCSSFTGAALALGGGVLYTASGSVSLAIFAASLAGAAALWIALVSMARGRRDDTAAALAVTLAEERLS